MFFINSFPLNTYPAYKSIVAKNTTNITKNTAAENSRLHLPLFFPKPIESKETANSSCKRPLKKKKNSNYKPRKIAKQ